MKIKISNYYIPRVVRHREALSFSVSLCLSLSASLPHTHTHIHMYVYVYICFYVDIDADGLEHLVAAARAEWWDTEKLVELRTDVYKAVKRY